MLLQENLVDGPRTYRVQGEYVDTYNPLKITIPENTSYEEAMGWKNLSDLTLTREPPVSPTTAKEARCPKGSSE